MFHYMCMSMLLASYSIKLRLPDQILTISIDTSKRHNYTNDALTLPRARACAVACIFFTYHLSVLHHSTTGAKPFGARAIFDVDTIIMSSSHSI